MKVFNKIVDLQNELFMCRKEGKEIGLVPTMGCLLYTSDAADEL